MMAACALRRPADPPNILHRLHEHLPLVDIICHQLRKQLGAAVRMDDLVSYGREGLLSAARTFDPTRGVPFRRWANIRIRGAVLDGIRASSSLPRSVYSRLRAMEDADRMRDGFSNEVSRVGTPEDADRCLGEYLSAMATAIALGFRGAGVDELGEPTDRARSVEETLVREELFAAIRTSIKELPVTERTLIQRHYFDGVTFEQAASELGLSKSWASRLHARAVGYLTRSLKRARAL